MPIVLSFGRAAILHRTRRAYVNFACALFLLTLLSSQVPAAVIIGTNTGPIPDGSNPNPTCGAPRDINFAVSGASAPVASLSLSVTMDHKYIGDLDVSLIAPDSTALTLFSFVGRTMPVGSNFGDSSNLNGTYVFSDVAPGNIWAAAASVGNGSNIPGGGYKAQMPGPFSPTNPGPPFVSLNEAFQGVANPNGNWTLRVLDCAAADTGTVSAASLTFLGPTAAGSVLSGRAISSTGRGLARVTISVSGGDVSGERRVVTNQFGYFTVDDLRAGLTYVVTASSKRFFFSNQTQVVNLGDDFDGLNFVAEP